MGLGMQYLLLASADYDFTLFGGACCKVYKNMAGPSEDGHDEWKLHALCSTGISSYMDMEDRIAAAEHADALAADCNSNLAAVHLEVTCVQRKVHTDVSAAVLLAVGRHFARKASCHASFGGASCQLVVCARCFNGIGQIRKNRDGKGTDAGGEQEVDDLYE
eukprot:5389717-Amphidinium_carterae.1